MVEGTVTHEHPSDSFNDHFSQARLFWNSLAPFEKKDLVDTFIFHLQYVKSKEVRQKNVEMWANVDKEMGATFAEHLGVDSPLNTNVPESRSSPAISMATTAHTAATQKVGVLIGEGFKGSEVSGVLSLLENQGVFVDFIGEKLGPVTGDSGSRVEINETFKTKFPVLYDALYIVGGYAGNQAEFNQQIMIFYDTAFRHYKPVGIATTVQEYIDQLQDNNTPGIIFAMNNPNFGDDFMAAITQKRFWDRAIYEQPSLAGQLS